MHTETSTTPAVQSTVTCPDCWGNGEFVTGSYSRTCSTCWGEGIVAVEADDEGDEPTPPARLDAPELLAEMAADEYAHDAETLRWAAVRAEAQRVTDPFIRRQIAATRTTVRLPWVEAL